MARVEWETGGAAARGMAGQSASAGGALFIGHEIYRHSSYGGKHPLAIPRVSLCIDLCRALGWLPAERYRVSPRATPEALARFHRPDYVEALQQAERDQALPEALRRRYQIGAAGNPIFPEVFRRPATAAGASILAAELLSSNAPEAPRIIFNPAGGTHHGRADRASGFCYVNDCVLAILALLDRGLERIVYLDIDAHHGDGVQDAFHDDPRVLTISLHQDGLWPLRAGENAGGLADRAGGAARNLPVPAGMNDSEFRYLLERAVLPLLEHSAPQVVVMQCGCDALAEDPLSRQALSNAAYVWALGEVIARSPRLLVLGGGGYNPWGVARCWSLLWGVITRQALPSAGALPSAARAVLDGIVWRHSLGRNPPPAWRESLLDQPRDGPIRPEVEAIAAATLA